jgi:uncharacterized protein (UPF0179 family)
MKIVSFEYWGNRCGICRLRPCMCSKVDNRPRYKMPRIRKEEDARPSWEERMKAIEEGNLGRKYQPVEVRRN